MRILQIHSEYSSSLVSGENSTVNAIAMALSEDNTVNRIIHSTDKISGFSRIKQLFLINKFRREIRRINSKDYDLIIVHNTIPFVESRQLIRLSKGVPVLRYWHNYRSLCIAGTNMRNGNPCFDCETRSFGRLFGIFRSCYRGSKIESTFVSLNEILFARNFHESNIWNIAISSHVARRITQSGFSDNRLRIIENFTEDFGNCGGNGRDFVFLGRLEHSKGIEQLLEAWIIFLNQISSTCNPPNLHVIGDGPLFEKLVDTYTSIGSVFFHGKLDRSEIELLVNGCSFGIAVPTWEEPFGKIVAEYLSMGITPIVASRGGIRDILYDASFPIFVDKPFSKNDIAVALLRAQESFLTEENKILIYNFWKERFSKYAYVKRMQSVYSEILREFNEV